MPQPHTSVAPQPLPDDGSPITLARSDADGFDIALRARVAEDAESAGEVVHELIVNGMFAMDSVDRSSELALADLASPTARRVLVGGLGLGFTAERVLQRCPDADVDVVDLSAALTGWARKGITPTLAAVSANTRAHLVAADIAQVLRPGSDDMQPDDMQPDDMHLPHAPWDAVLLDVDNGPDFLIHDHNAALYDADLLAAALGCVAPGGVLGVWSERESTALADRLAELTASTGTLLVSVERDGHRLDYAIHWARPGAGDADGAHIR